MSIDDVFFYHVAEKNCDQLSISTVSLAPLILNAYLAGDFFTVNKSRGRFLLNIKSRNIGYAIEFIFDANIGAIRVQKVIPNGR